MTHIRVFKLDETGHEVLHYDGEVVARGTTWVHLRAIFQVEVAELGFVTFNKGDVFHEWFYTDRWYNIFRIEDGASGKLKGWYCNITRPAVITAETVKSDDLALDVFVMPDGTVRILDEDEFKELVLTDEERTQALAGVEQIRQQLANGATPFEGVAPQAGDNSDTYGSVASSG